MAQGPAAGPPASPRRGLRTALADARLAAMHRAMRVLPTGLSSAIGGNLGRLVGRTLYRRTSARMRATAAALRPDLDAAAIARAVAGVWDTIGRCYAEFASEDRMWDEGRITVAGEANLRAAQASGRPIVIAGLHLGNWELLQNVARFGLPLAIVYQPQPSAAATRIVVEARLRTCAAIGRAMGMTGGEVARFFPPTPTAGTEIVHALRAGRTLLIYLDDQIGGKVRTPTFGRKAHKEGNLVRVVRMARATGAIVVPSYVERVAGARFVIHLLDPIVPDFSGDRGQAMRAAMLRLDRALRPPVLDHIDQWFMLPYYRPTG